jgi:hypothetical protein
MGAKLARRFHGSIECLTLVQRESKVHDSSPDAAFSRGLSLAHGRDSKISIE